MEEYGYNTRFNNGPSIEKSLGMTGGGPHREDRLAFSLQASLMESLHVGARTEPSVSCGYVRLDLSVNDRMDVRHCYAGIYRRCDKISFEKCFALHKYYTRSNRRFNLQR